MYDWQADCYNEELLEQAEMVDKGKFNDMAEEE